MPAVIGVVFVFLVGVVIWVIVSSGGDGDDAAPADAPTASDVSGDAPATSGDSATTTEPDAAVDELIGALESNAQE